MKNLVLLLMLLIGSTFSSAQTKKGTNWLKAGMHVGTPLGEMSDYANLVVGADVKYQFLNRRSFGIGFATGYEHYFGKEYEVDNIKYDAKDVGVVPMALLLRYYPKSSFFIGADVGYAFTSGSPENNGGFYYRPELGFHSNNWNFFGYYSSILDHIPITSIGIGAHYNIIQKN